MSGVEVAMAVVGTVADIVSAFNGSRNVNRGQREQERSWRDM
jgi:hypothetical protein